MTATISTNYNNDYNIETPAGAPPGVITMVTGSGETFNSNGGNINITAGNGEGIGQIGGNITLQAGGGLTGSNGGGIGVFGGSSTTIGDGGQVVISGGNGGSISGSGASASLAGGFASDGDGGSVILFGAPGGATDRNGGEITLQAGFSTGTANLGGRIHIIAGDIVGIGGVAGDIFLRPGTAPVGSTAGKLVTITSGGFSILTSGEFVGGNDDARTVEYVLRTQTTNAIITEMFLDGTAGTRRMVLTGNSTWKFFIQIAARNTAAVEGAGYNRSGAIGRGLAAATTALISTVDTIGADKENIAAWDVTVDADTTNGSLRIRVTGEVGKTIRWVAFVRTVEVKGG